MARGTKGNGKGQGTAAATKEKASRTPKAPKGGATRESREENRRAEAREALEAREQSQSVTIITVFLALLIMAVTCFYLVQVFIAYQDSGNDLARAEQEKADLEKQKADLEGEIERWNDSAYVEAQARSRLGYVYPGEKPVYLVNVPRSVSGEGDAGTSDAETTPWYTRLYESVENADNGGTGADTMGNALSAEPTPSESPSDEPSGDPSASPTPSASDETDGDAGEKTE